MFQTVFAATTATIVSGAMAERTKFSMSFLAGLILFYGIRFTFGLRVAPRIEEESLNIYEHGEAAYN